METQIRTDKRLLAEAAQLTGLNEDAEVINEALRLLIHVKRQEEIRTSRGKLRWEGDLDRMRREA